MMDCAIGGSGEGEGRQWGEFGEIGMITPVSLWRLQGFAVSLRDRGRRREVVARSCKKFRGRGITHWDPMNELESRILGRLINPSSRGLLGELRESLVVARVLGERK